MVKKHIVHKREPKSAGLDDLNPISLRRIERGVPDPDGCWNALTEEIVNSSLMNASNSHITPMFKANKGLVTRQRWVAAFVQTSSESY